MFSLLIEQIQARLNILEVARWLGLEVRGSRAPCPFHNERSVGAFRLYEQTNSCYCYSCHTGGDIIKLVGAAMEISPIAAVREIDKAFNLGLRLDVQEKPTQKQIKVAQEFKQQQAIKALNEQCKMRFRDILKELERWSAKYCPKTPAEQWDRRYIFALKHRDIVSFYLGLAQFPSDAVEFIAQMTKRMETLLPEWKEKRLKLAEIDSLYDTVISGEITLETFLKKHSKAVKEFERIM